MISLNAKKVHFKTNTLLILLEKGVKKELNLYFYFQQSIFFFFRTRTWILLPPLVGSTCTAGYSCCWPSSTHDIWDWCTSHGLRQQSACLTSMSKGCETSLLRGTVQKICVFLLQSLWQKGGGCTRRRLVPLLAAASSRLPPRLNRVKVDVRLQATAKFSVQPFNARQQMRQ